MMIKFIGPMSFIFTLAFSINAKSGNCGNVASEIINLTYKMHKEFEKTKSGTEVMKKYGKSLGEKIDEMGNLGDKYPECRKEYDAAASEATYQLKDITKQAQEKLPQVVSYDEWFTLQSTGIKSGKKYSFIACVNGQRNLTAIRCHVPGSAAKRVFYNTDDIKDLETRKKWVNTSNQVMCVTAYVTGHEAFIVDLRDQNECK